MKREGWREEFQVWAEMFREDRVFRDIVIGFAVFFAFIFFVAVVTGG